MHKICGLHKKNKTNFVTLYIMIVIKKWWNIFFFENLKEDSILVDANFCSIKELIFKWSLLKHIVYSLKNKIEIFMAKGM